MNENIQTEGMRRGYFLNSAVFTYCGDLLQLLTNVLIVR